MCAFPISFNEEERLAALQSYHVLDTACEAVFDELAQLAARLTGCPMAAVSLIDEKRQWFKARVGLDVSETPRDFAFCAHTICGTEPFVVPNAPADPRFAENPLVTGDLGIRFYAGVPLVNPEGFALGTLCVIDQQHRALTDLEMASLLGLARAVMTTLDLRRAMNTLREIAATDVLTGLPNRAAFMLALKRMMAFRKRSGCHFTVLFFDLDGFKRINDRLGHATGDRVLQAVAETLAGNVREEDVAARFGGDEFAVLLITADDAPQDTAAERLRVAIEQKMASLNWAVTASVGSCRFVDSPPDLATAIAAADAEMYRAKAAGRNRVSYADWRTPAIAEPALDGVPMGHA